METLGSSHTIMSSMVKIEHCKEQSKAFFHFSKTSSINYRIISSNLNLEIVTNRYNIQQMGKQVIGLHTMELLT